MSGADFTALKIEFAIGIGAMDASTSALMLEIETETASTSSASIGTASIESSWSGSWFTIEANPAGIIETGGLIADDVVSAADWVDVSAYVTACSVRHQKPSRFSGFDARTLSLTLTDDETRTWDPLNLSGTYVAGTTSLLREGMRVRVSYTYLGTQYWLFTGGVSSWPVSLNTWPAGEVQVECHDWFGLLSRGESVAVAAVGADETVDARIGRILDQYGVPTVERDIGTSLITCQSTTLGDNVLSALRAAAASDGGDIWCEPDGRVTFRSFADQWSSDQRNRTQWTLTNTPTGAALECDYEPEPAVSNDLRDTISAVLLQRVGGVEQSATDSGLLVLYGNRITSRTDLVNANDTDVLTLAAQIVATQPTLPVRISQATIRPDIHAEALAMAIGARLWDRVAVSHTQVTGGVITRAGLIVGVEHRIDGSSTWSTTYTLQDCTGLTVFTIGESDIAGTDMIV